MNRDGRMGNGLRFSCTFVTLVAVAATALVSCGPAGEPGAATGSASASTELISDAVHGSGTPGFFFLPPIARLTRYGSTVAPCQWPTVVIEELGAGNRGTIATFTRTAAAGVPRIMTDSRCLAYSVVWNYRLYGIQPAVVYRIHVLDGGKELGFADAKLARTLADVANFLRTGIVPLAGGSQLISFRIEPDALTPPSKCAGVVCAAKDQCHVAGTCDPATGTCSDPLKPDGSVCDDANACTKADTCQAGVCVGSGAITCTAMDRCHAAGTCNPASGTCSNPVLPDGTACSDGNACTLTDTCQAGTCVGTNPLVCTAADQCHAAGACDAVTGMCSSPTLPDGTPCNDGNGLTGNDVCNGGICAGTPLGPCVALDQCHAAGVRDPTTGLCSNPPRADGTSCNDGNACTQSDTCQSGICTGSSPVTCTALDPCHVAGTCNPADGTCSNPAAPNGSACNDRNACTQTDTCQSGVCTGSQPVVCVALDQCHLAGTCDPVDGSCSNPAAPNGTGCSDGNACTESDACQSGTCTGSSLVTCTAMDQCHVAGTCNPVDGSCSNPAAPDGTGCDDGDACTQGDTCQVGVCTGTLSPAALTADPNVVYNGVNTAVTVAASAALEFPVTVSIRPLGATDPVTKLDVSAVGGYPERVRAIVPAGQDTRIYDLLLSDTGGCPASLLPRAVTVTNAVTLCLQSVTPPSGPVTASTTITILRDPYPPGCTGLFEATPFVFLNPSNPMPSDVAIGLPSVSLVDGDTLKAVIPSGLAVHSYDLVVVNPGGAVGLLLNAFDVVSAPGGCMSNSDCYDADACTYDECGNDGVCRHSPVKCDDGDPLTIDACVNGTCVYTPVGSCTKDSDCPPAKGECQTAVCISGACALSPMPAGIPISIQVPGDCQKNVCDGVGGTTSIPDDTDLPADDGNTCTSEACVNGSPAHVPAAPGTACNQNGGTVCDGFGQCIAQCAVATDCPGSDTECATRTCTASACGFSFAPQGTSCVGGVCDGAGKCYSGQCAAASDCPGKDTECATRTCTNASCGFNFAPKYTPCKDGGVICDGAGNCMPN